MFQMESVLLFSSSLFQPKTSKLAPHLFCFSTFSFAFFISSFLLFCIVHRKVCCFILSIPARMEGHRWKGKRLVLLMLKYSFLITKHIGSLEKFLWMLCDDVLLLMMMRSRMGLMRTRSRQANLPTGCSSTIFWSSY